MLQYLWQAERNILSSLSICFVQKHYSLSVKEVMKKFTYPISKSPPTILLFPSVLGTVARALTVNFYQLIVIEMVVMVVSSVMAQGF